MSARALIVALLAAAALPAAAQAAQAPRPGVVAEKLTLPASGKLTRSIGAHPYALSLDVIVPRGAALELRAGSARRVLRGGGRRHLELAGGLGGPLRLRVLAGKPSAGALVVTPAGDRGALLLQRLAELHARLRPGQSPWGQGSDGVLHLSNGWTSGFWPGSLWRAYDLTGARLFRGWALAATLAHLGDETDQSHDQGFRYLESSAAAYDRLCGMAKSRTCRRLRTSALRAANVLVALQRDNPGAGTIPTLPVSKACRLCRSKDEAETIIDSMMNVGLVDWAWRQTGRASYRSAVETHARGAARLLVRPDGSTYQAVRVSRSSGAVLGYTTHQGLSDSSTWSRGQAWAVYGFATTGSDLDEPEFVGVAERAARYVADHLPAAGVPPWDYAAPAGAPIDTSAGIITAAGLFRLADACARLPGSCSEPDRWRPLAERMRAASLAYVSAQRPLGYLDRQVFSMGGSQPWDDRGDFIFGTDYALEALGQG